MQRAWKRVKANKGAAGVDGLDIAQTGQHLKHAWPLGGDEFALILEDFPTRAAAERIGSKLVDAVRRPFRIGERSLTVSTSIGIAFFEPGIGPDELIHRADQAMYSAKRAGRDRFEIASHPATADRA